MSHALVGIPTPAIPDTPAELLRAAESVMTWDHPEFAEFARVAKALYRCVGKYSDEYVDPLFCDYDACGCITPEGDKIGRPIITAECFPITRKILRMMRVDEEQSLAWMMEQTTGCDCDCDLVESVVEPWEEGPEAIFRYRQNAACNSLQGFRFWYPYIRARIAREKRGKQSE